MVHVYDDLNNVCDTVIEDSWNCVDNDPNNTNGSGIWMINDCDGVRSWEDCDDNDPNNTNNNM